MVHIVIRDVIGWLDAPWSSLFGLIIFSIWSSSNSALPFFCVFPLWWRLLVPPKPLTILLYLKLFRWIHPSRWIIVPLFLDSTRVTDPTACTQRCTIIDYIYIRYNFVSSILLLYWLLSTLKYSENDQTNQTILTILFSQCRKIGKMIKMVKN